MKWTRFASLLLACVAAVPTEQEFDMERDLVVGKSPRPTRIHARAQTPRNCTTNAECLRKRMPLLPPKQKRAGAMRPRTSPCVPQTYKGYIRATNTATGADMGYLSAKRGLLGAFGVYVPSTTGTQPALGVQFDACPGTVAQSIDIMVSPAQQTVNGKYYPYLGAFTNWDLQLPPSRDDFGPSETLLYLAAMSESTGPGATPNSQVVGSYSTWFSKLGWNAESQIWNFDPVTRAITLTWVNYGGSTYTGKWVNDPAVLSFRGNQLAASGDKLPAGRDWAPVKLVLEPTTDW